MTAEGERKNTKASRKRLLECQVLLCIREHHRASEGTWGWGDKEQRETRSSVQTDSPTNTQIFKNSIKLKTAKELLISTSDIF